MGALLVLVFPCFSFRENVIVTCKIVPFLCSSDNFLQKNVIIFFYGNQISKWCSFEKRTNLYLLFTFLVPQPGKRHISSFSIYLTYIHTLIFLTILNLIFCLSNFGEKNQIYQVWFLFGATPTVDSTSRHFRAINK